MQDSSVYFECMYNLVGNWKPRLETMSYKICCYLTFTVADVKTDSKAFFCRL